VINFPDKIAEKLIENKCRNSDVTELDKKKVKYGVYIFYVNITKILVLLLAAFLLDVLYQVLLIWFFFALLRRTAFGIHSSSSLVCTFVTLITFVGGALISKNLIVSDLIIYSIYIICFIAMFIYAPADTEARPLVGKKFRKRLKIETLITFVLILASVIYINIYNLKIIFAIAGIAETVSILPITYKVCRRRYKNYDNKINSKCK
jgi:accessory gene regulator B